MAVEYYKILLRKLTVVLNKYIYKLHYKFKDFQMALSITKTVLSFVSAVVFSALMHTTLGAPAMSPEEHHINKRDASSGSTVEFIMPNDTFSSTSDYFSTEDPDLVIIASKSKKERDVRVYPSKVAEGIDVPVYERSTCPWYYEIEHDATRYPPTILRAKKLCPRCIGNEAMECVHITQTRTLNIKNGNIYSCHPCHILKKSKTSDYER